jgi:hypothetical protein
MIEGFAILSIALLLMFGWGWFELRTFLRKHSEVATAEDLAAFKSLARFNMHLALSYLLLGSVMLIWLVQMAHIEGLKGVLLGLSFSVPSAWLGHKIKALELQSRSLPSSDTTQAEYAQVSQTWVRKLWPNF